MKLGPLHLPFSGRIRKALAKINYILNQRLQTNALLDLKKSHMEAKKRALATCVKGAECITLTLLLVLFSQ